MRLILSFLFLLTFKVFACEEANTLKRVYAEVDSNGSMPYIRVYASSEYDDFIISGIGVIVENDFSIGSSIEPDNNGYHRTSFQLKRTIIDKTFIVITYQLKNSEGISLCGPRNVYELSKIIT